jgi:hypothetical protein
MKTATSLTVIALGAILAFAITTSPGFLNIQVVGLILMITGAVGLLLSARDQNWLRRRVVVRRTPAPRVPRRTSATRQRQRAVRQLPPPVPAAPADTTRPIERDTFDEYIER